MVKVFLGEVKKATTRNLRDANNFAHAKRLLLTRENSERGEIAEYPAHIVSPWRHSPKNELAGYSYANKWTGYSLSLSPSLSFCSAEDPNGVIV